MSYFIERNESSDKRKKSLPKPDDFDPLYAEHHYIYADYEDETVTGGMGDDWRVNFTRTDNNKITVRNIVTNEVIEIYDWEFISDSTFTVDEYDGGEFNYDLESWGDWEYTYTSFDSTRNITRHSIRPKIKLKLFEGNIVFDYRFYYKPNVSDFDDYLLVNELKISIATFYEALSLSINYNDSYNSQYDYEGSPVKSKDSDISIGLSFDL